MQAEEAINKLLRDSVNLILGQSEFAIRGRQDAPRPKSAYAIVDFVNATALGWEQENFINQADPDLDLSFTRERSQNFMYSFRFLREGAYDNANRVHIGLVREQIRLLFWQAEVGIVTRSEVRNISEPREVGFEEVAQFDIVVNTVGSDTEIVTSILSLDMNLEYHSRGLIQTSTIGVS